MQSFFEYTPVMAAGGKGDDKGKDRDQDRNRDNDKNDNDKNKEGPVRTQMVGESPGDDLGYDPSIIPTEPIPDDED